MDFNNKILIFFDFSFVHYLVTVVNWNYFLKVLSIIVLFCLFVYLAICLAFAHIFFPRQKVTSFLLLYYNYNPSSSECDLLPFWLLTWWAQQDYHHHYSWIFELKRIKTTKGQIYILIIFFTCRCCCFSYIFVLFCFWVRLTREVVYSN